MNNAMSMLTNVACRCLEKVICFRRKPGQRSREAMAHTTRATAASMQEGVPVVGSLWHGLS